VSVKIIRNKNTAVSEGYGFVEFATHEAAEQVLRTFNGCPIPNTDQIFRLNWAAFGVGKVTTDGEAEMPGTPFPCTACLLVPLR
jgi:RNA recognition motif-containing protein